MWTIVKIKFRVCFASEKYVYKTQECWLHVLALPVQPQEGYDSCLLGIGGGSGMDCEFGVSR